MASAPASSVISLLDGSDAIDRSSLPLQLYTETQAKALSHFELGKIMVQQPLDSLGNNVYCRQCENTFKSTLQSNKIYFKKDNLQKHLIRRHFKKESVFNNQSTLPDSYSNSKVTYIKFRMDLIKSMIYKYVPFNSTDYQFTISAF